jgi:SAM-dependent methyltransferase
VRALTAHDADHWDDLAVAWSQENPQRLWRAYSDAVNGAFFAYGSRAASVPRVLKTDLFDEIAGEGLYPRLSKQAKTVIGIDLSDSVANAARENRPGLQVVRCDVRALPFVAGAFPVILSNSTLDHFENPDDIGASICELSRVLSPQGDLLLTLDNLANPVVALRNALPFHLVRRLGLVPYYVGASCGPVGLRRLLRQANLQTVEITAISHWPRFVGVVIARLVSHSLSESAIARVVHWALSFEVLARFPTRFLTGYFVAAHATTAATSIRAESGSIYDCSS